MKVHLKMIKKLVKLKFFFLLVIIMKVILKIINLMGMDIIYGKKMVMNILVNI